MSEGHAILSPSGAKGWIKCRGKPAMEKGMPDGSNEHSDYGTAAHTVGSMVLTRNVDPVEWYGKRIDVRPGVTVECDADMVDGVRLYWKAVLAVIDRYKLAGAVSVEMLVEQRVPIGHLTGEAGAEGTADVVLIVMFPDGEYLLHVIDLKFGIGVVVPVEENEQEMIYALGTVKKLAMVAEFKRVVLSIHQPRVNDEPIEWETDIDHLMGFAENVVKPAAFHAMNVYDNEKPEALIHHLTAGEHCRTTFCKARATCPKARQAVEAGLGAGFEVVREPTEVMRNAIKPELAECDEFDLGLKMRAIDYIEDWCKAVRAEVERRLLAGIQVKGFKLVQGRMGNRSWGSREEAEKLLKSFRLKQEEMYSFSLISPTDAERLAPKVGKDGKPKDGDKTPLKLGQWQKLQPLIVRAEGKPSVAPETDKRPALVISAAGEGFTEVQPGSSLI